VLHRISQGFLDDAVQRELSGRGQRERLPGHGEANRQARLTDGADHGGEVGECGLRRVPGHAVFWPAQDTEHPAHLGQGGAARLRDVAHHGRRLVRVLRDRVGGAVGERDHHGDVMGDDVMHFPGDPGTFRGRGKLYVPLPLPLQVRPPAARVVAEQAGDGHQDGARQPCPHDLFHAVPAAEAQEGEKCSAALKRDHGGQHAPVRLLDGNRVKRDKDGQVIGHLYGVGERLREGRREDDPEDRQRCLPPPEQREHDREDQRHRRYRPDTR
jgi:hypothetical protein